MPRRVPLSLLNELLICTKRASRPAAANSRSQKKRAKKPRSSSRLSSSITKAPSSGVGRNRIGSSGRLSLWFSGDPVEAMAYSAQPDEPAAVEITRREAVCPVPRQQLLHAGGERVFEPEIRQQSSKPCEIDAVIARVFADLACVDDAGTRH